MMIEHEALYTAVPQAMGFLACCARQESGEPIAWIRAGYVNDARTHEAGLTIMGPYNTVEEARAMCERLRQTARLNHDL